ncbi:hypothetical protein Ahy_A03g013297 [Arachis hypogaea]|uniref:DUF4283 domain-containing protein n=1 Tax=Arachis hypogaea TaxID=3818 RepID=A0A445DV58_ARAHY|nr:hypothetical protein Ahy_A03g013297 [Arachis hypogaea]
MDLVIADQALFIPKLTIDVSLEEYKNWCKPWKISLIVKPLDKIFNLQALDRWVKRKCIKKETIRIMDLARKFFLFRFTDQGDYVLAFFERPWIIVNN